MLQYTFKTYIFGGVEHYVYGEAYADDTVVGILVYMHGTELQTIERITIQMRFGS